MPLSYVKHSNGARVLHKTLNLTCAPDGVETPLTVVFRSGATSPQRIIKTVALEDDVEWQWLIVSLGLAKVLKQLPPTIVARIMSANLVESGGNHLRLFSI
jgi:hypothetical protein